MFEVVVMWNLSRPDEDPAESTAGIELRGYSPEAFLTGEFATKLRDRVIPSLSVSDIADKYCAVRRDLYFRKGVNRLSGGEAQGRGTWGRAAGNLVESYLRWVFDRRNTRNTRTYARMRGRGKRELNEFKGSHGGTVDNLMGFEGQGVGPQTGDTDWLLKLIENNGTAELAMKLLHAVLKHGDFVDHRDVSVSCEIAPTPERIGLSRSVTADFIIASARAIGDVKTGVCFKPYYQLTCAGYALAYENQHGAGSEIDWGIIYFFPTRNPTAYVRPLTFGQIYIFPINDDLRRWFISFRDEAYNTVSKSIPPGIPPDQDRDHCPYCAFVDYCTSQGMQLPT